MLPPTLEPRPIAAGMLFGTPHVPWRGPLPKIPSGLGVSPAHPATAGSKKCRVGEAATKKRVSILQRQRPNCPTSTAASPCLPTSSDGWNDEGRGRGPGPQARPSTCKLLEMCHQAVARHRGQPLVPSKPRICRIEPRKWIIITLSQSLSNDRIGGTLGRFKMPRWARPKTSEPRDDDTCGLFAF